MKKEDHGEAFKHCQPSLSLLPRVALATTKEQLSKAVKEENEENEDNNPNVSSLIDFDELPKLRGLWTPNYLPLSTRDLTN